MDIKKLSPIFFKTLIFIISGFGSFIAYNLYQNKILVYGCMGIALLLCGYKTLDSLQLVEEDRFKFSKKTMFFYAIVFSYGLLGFWAFLSMLNLLFSTFL